jgi:hypothetical protein
MSTESCPHCGTSIRSRPKVLVVGLFGVVLVAGSLFEIGSLWVFGLIGFVLASISAYLVYDQRERMNEAETSDESVLRSADGS